MQGIPGIPQGYNRAEEEDTSMTDVGNEDEGKEETNLSEDTSMDVSGEESINKFINNRLKGFTGLKVKGKADEAERNEGGKPNVQVDSPGRSARSLTPEQTGGLEEAFAANSRPNPGERAALAASWGVTEGRVARWFKARRGRQELTGGGAGGGTGVGSAEAGVAGGGAEGDDPMEESKDKEQNGAKGENEQGEGDAKICIFDRDTGESKDAQECSECGVRERSRVEVLRHTREHHYSLYLSQLTGHLFPGGRADCASCGEGATNLPRQLMHIGEKHMGFARLVRHGEGWVGEVDREDRHLYNTLT